MRYVVFGRDNARPYPPALPMRPSSAIDRHSSTHGAVTTSPSAKEIRSSFFLAIYKGKVSRNPPRVFWHICY